MALPLPQPGPDDPQPVTRATLPSKRFTMLRPSVRSPVQGHHSGAAQARVVLKGQARTLHLARIGAAAQLMSQLVALRQAGCAQRMALGQQPARGVDDDRTAIGVVIRLNEGPALADGAETQ